MKPIDIQQFFPLVVAVFLIAVMSRRMLRPRRFRMGSLLIAPPIMAAGIIFFLATHAAPSPLHAARLVLALMAGGALGWTRAKLVKLEFNPVSGLVTQRGTPYGLVLLLLVFGMRSFVQIAAAKDPTIGIGLRQMSDLLLLLGFGIVTGYAVTLYYAAARARLAAGIAVPDQTVSPLD